MSATEYILWVTQLPYFRIIRGVTNTPIYSDVKRRFEVSLALQNKTIYQNVKTTQLKLGGGCMTCLDL